MSRVAALEKGLGRVAGGDRLAGWEVSTAKVLCGCTQGPSDAWLGVGGWGLE